MNEESDISVSASSAKPPSWRKLVKSPKIPFFSSFSLFPPCGGLAELAETLIWSLGHADMRYMASRILKSKQRKSVGLFATFAILPFGKIAPKSSKTPIFPSIFLFLPFGNLAKVAKTSDRSTPRLLRHCEEFFIEKILYDICLFPMNLLFLDVLSLMIG
ncbi:MAG: hypothetical protein SO402_02425 [Prevotella sp.]|nr:hypothetical protein [Parabacteroides sp.]MDY4653208.1 hypothetical protein [Prevotella sp.]